MSRQRTFYVYILTNRSGTMYTGMNSNLIGRLIQHRDGLVPGFTRDRNIKRLVYFELIEDAYSAVTRERQIKKWNRARKIRLVETMNPTWADLSQDLLAGRDPHVAPMRHRASSG